ncbi:MAG: hypothetical protein B5M54_06395 [Candidatus Aminicenantes bacterium 4484_214]|nr:MAG: hypothetical protein B5M54_06395 [Candidatus Aminicenantes bacterium 4484_214]RLE09720.1 MAG: ABC transporter ATP-binding protein [Candidatus Aminicenantes bacterium]
MTNNDAILTRNLRKFYPRVRGYRDLIFHPWRKEFITALQEINIRVQRGTCFFLVGPNGAGKTTLVKILTTLVRPDGGKAFILGYDLFQHEKRIRKLVSLAIAEERSFYWRLTAKQNLEFFAALYGYSRREARRRISEVLELVGLASVAEMRFNTFSAGMKQLLGLARAMLSDAEIIFVDEPTKSLDPQSANKIRQFLRHELVKRQGKTVFWASHNLDEVETYADEVAIINQGKIMVQGPIEKLLAEGRRSLFHLYVQYVDRDEEEFSRSRIGE